jgi:hypothetical protein
MEPRKALIGGMLLDGTAPGLPTESGRVKNIKNYRFYTGDISPVHPVSISLE